MGDHMSRAKRIVAAVVMVLSVLVFALSVAAVIGAWAINGPVTDGMLGVLTSIESSVQVADTTISNFSARIDQAQAVVNEIEDRVVALGQEDNPSELVVNVISELVNQDLQAVIEDMRQTIHTIEDIATSIKNAIEALNSLPFVSLQIPAVDKVLEVAETVSMLSTKVEELQAAIDARIAGAIEELVDVVTGITSSIDGLLSQAQAALAEYNARLTQVEAGIAALKSTLPGLIDSLSIALTLFGVWMAFSQAGLFVLGLSFYNGRDLLARWRDVPLGIKPPASELTSGDSASV
jgi:hypothetical protein